jgi:hypothetical protein
MAYTTIDDPSAHFQIKLYTGDGSTLRAITNDGNSDLQPDLIWHKRRDAAVNNLLTDSSRGAFSQLVSNNSNAEGSSSTRVKSFDTDGFTVGDANPVNLSGGTYVAWQWKANGGTTSSNTDGSITSTVQANTDAGFSIVTYTGTGTAATVGHGLGVAPKFYVVKNRDATGTNWTCYHEGLTSNQYYLYLDSTAGQSNAVDFWDSTSPTSSVFSIKASSDNVNNAYDYVAYCFAEKQGFSKFGSYTGNGNANGTFIYTGFKPAFVMIKKTNGTGAWIMYDNKRNSYTGNYIHYLLQANYSDAEVTNLSYPIDFLSNGFKLRGGSLTNDSGGTYIYMAFAENPFVTSTGIPTTAR